ncbi:MAG: FHA domain-containing protein [Deltaproteobacteria bacterium]|nr:FHA domain-containing protein [Deltaproteobacteria bacterium]
MTKIGRAPHCEVVLNDPLVSREHALLQNRPEGIVLEDLNSANGTLVNDQRITKVSLHPGDKLRLGLSEILLEQIPEEEVLRVPPVQTPDQGLRPGVREAVAEPRQAEPEKPKITQPAPAPETKPPGRPELSGPPIPLVAPHQEAPLLLIIHPGCPRMEQQLEPLVGSGAVIRQALQRDQVRAALRSSAPDCILLCHQMPATLEIYQELRSQAPNVPVVLLLHGDPWTETLPLIQSGVDEILNHLDFTEFQVRIRNMVEMNRLRKEALLVTSQVEKRVSDDVSEAERINRLKRYLSPQLVAAVLSGEESHVLKPTRQEVTIVFSDLRNYTQFSEVSEPEEIISMLKDFHALYGEIIFQYDGTLERFAGDGVMVFFGAPVPFKDHARRAVAMAADARERLLGLRNKWERLGYSLDISFGISTGYVFVGNIGFEGRMDYAAIGKTTNLAARLCAAAKGGQILISRKTLFQVEDIVEVEEIGALEVKGFSHPVAAYNVLCLKAPYIPTPVS